MADKDPLADLDALRKIIEALQPFNPDDQKRLLRWAHEKLGLSAAITTAGDIGHRPTPEDPSGEGQRVHSRSPRPTLRGFVESKNPKGTYDQIACVLYYAKEFSGQTEHSIEEIRKLLIAAKIKPPSKMSTTVADCCRRTGYIKNVARGTWTLADHGESRVAVELPEGAK